MSCVKTRASAVLAALLTATLGSGTVACIAFGPGAAVGGELSGYPRDQLCIDSQQVTVLGHPASSPQVCAPDLPIGH